MALTRLKRISHKSLAAFMALWMSGAVLLICTVQMPGQSADDFCPLTKLGAHCDKAKQNKDAQSLTTQTDEQGIDCCAFIPAFFDKTRTIDGNQQVAADVPATAIEQPRLVAIRVTFHPAFRYRSTVLLKNNTFLKNRTFRI
ncbi:MAG TPA: hypothetical protein VGQ55_02425 [Pyrinomonadaceae bacterium]|nr:hypothetical protein [Pyrinomonadaceae bacterium]